MNQSKPLTARCEENRQRLVKLYAMRKAGLTKTQAYQKLKKIALSNYHALNKEQDALIAQRKMIAINY